MHVCVCVCVKVEPSFYSNGSETSAVCVAQMFLSTITATGFPSKCTACVCNLPPIGCGASMVLDLGARSFADVIRAFELAFSSHW